MKIHAEHNDTMKTSDTVLRKNIPLTLFERVCVWVGVGDRTELQYIDPHSYGHQCCVFLVLQGCSIGGLGALSAGCWLSHLVTKLHRGSRGPLLLGGGFLYHTFSLTHLVSKLTDFLSHPLNISPKVEIGNVSLPLSLEWHVWSSSSRNNCHTVHRLLSSGASVCECTAGFYLVPFWQPSSPRSMEYATSASLEWQYWRVEGQYTTKVHCLNLLQSYLIHK